ncbi:YccV-like-domain-containing protein [Mycena belliarum]|uniref:YccV-like-domain-containing protein n=1 Tax=Mycena belliarum TaxID=1033014 RepID=A0AAD6XXP5_9AGAR|nr:YccV-like-domain-containing protein [Mycena belliae]
MALPLDLYISILAYLPAGRLEAEGGVPALVNCLRANTLLREAAQVPSLWESHYRARYLHSEHIDSSSSEPPNWRLIYAARRHQDNLALDLLDKIVSQREGRYQHAATLAALSFGVWDVLEIECSLPIPEILGGNLAATPYALTRRFWASSILESISRRFAIIQWGTLANPQTARSISFVDAFSSLSCFFGRPPQEIRSRLLDLGDSCHSYLINKGCSLNPSMPEYDLPDLCAKICQFMHEKGFGPAESTRFYDISNQFPHIYLTTNKLSIPISLVHIFVSIARHPSIGISASPVEFPARVLVHIPSPPDADDFLVDVFGAQTKAIISLRDDIPAMLMRLGIPPDNLNQYVSPCGAAPMLLRAARNILSSFRNDASRSTAQSAICAAVCIHLLLTNETQLVTHMLSHIDLDPLYCTTFLSDLRPLLLRNGSQNLLETACQNALEIEQQEAVVVHRRTPQVPIAHCVGMVFEHRRYLYMGCIIGWDATCAATEEWQEKMHVNNLGRGAMQPFYHVLSLDGGQRYVAEDNIEPMSLTPDLARQFLTELPSLPRYFSDLKVDSGRGRWQLSPEMQRAYPHDDQTGQL